MIRSLAIAAFLLGALSCAEKPDVCVDDGDCSGDKPMACIEEVCTEVECLGSDTCGLFEYCNENYNCIPGCETDDDCMAGETCDPSSHACLAYGCRDTQLDCGIGEVCNEGTGECEPDTSGHCVDCDPWSWSGCGESGECFYWDENYEETYCLQTCVLGVEDQCPRGFQCADATGSGQGYCYADCKLFHDNDWL